MLGDAIASKKNIFGDQGEALMEETEGDVRPGMGVMGGGKWKSQTTSGRPCLLSLETFKLAKEGYSCSQAQAAMTKMRRS